MQHEKKLARDFKLHPMVVFARGRPYPQPGLDLDAFHARQERLDAPRDGEEAHGAGPSLFEPGGATLADVVGR